MIRTWLTRLSFFWETASHPVVLHARRLVDGELRRTFPSVRIDSDDDTASCAYVGLRAGLRHIVPFVASRMRDLTGNARVHDGRPVRWRRFVQDGSVVDADLVLVGTTAARAAGLLDSRSFLMPMRCQLVSNVAATPQEMLARLGARDLKRFSTNRRRRDWHLTVGTARADFDEFYDNFHAPTMRNRYGDAARSMSRTMAYECLFRHGILFFVMDEGVRVAGMLCRWDARERELTFRLTGVAGGDSGHYRSRAFAARYPLLMEWAAAHGVHRIDMSGFEPFVSKGIFQFKRRFGPSVVLPSSHYAQKRVCLSIRRDTPWVRDFLVRNPLITMQEDGFEVVFFFDRTRPVAAELEWVCGNLDRRRCVDLDEFFAATERKSLPICASAP